MVTPLKKADVFEVVNAYNEYLKTTETPTKKEFCEQHQIKEGKLYRCLARVKKSGTKSIKFTPQGEVYKRYLNMVKYMEENGVTVLQACAALKIRRHEWDYAKQQFEGKTIAPVDPLNTKAPFTLQISQPQLPKEEIKPTVPTPPKAPAPAAPTTDNIVVIVGNRDSILPILQQMKILG